MSSLIAGLVLLLGTHSISIVSESWRDAMAARIGTPAWKGIYSLVALAGFVLIVHGYGAARLNPVVLYSPPDWLKQMTVLVMLPVFPLLLAAYLPGRLKAAVKHPMLLAVKFWAFAHLLANGSVADLLLFGGFLTWAVADRISMKHRTSRRLPGPPESGRNDVIAVIGGFVIYVLFVSWLHPLLIGVPVIG